MEPYDPSNNTTGDPCSPGSLSRSETTFCFFSRYYTEDRDHEMDMWVVVGDTENKHLTLVVTPYKVSTSVDIRAYFKNMRTK